MVIENFNYNFPAYQLPEGAEFDTQLQYIVGEVSEASNAEFRHDTFETVMELMDVIHATETALRMLNVDNETLNAARFAVVQKNKERGYYEKGDE